MSGSAAPSYGVVGLGAMGLPMALNLAAAGMPVVAWNRSDRPHAEARAAGIDVVETLAEVGDRCAVVLTVLPDLPQVEAVLDGGLRGVSLTHLVVMGTVSPVGVRSLPDRYAGLRVVDAPVSGGTAGARAGTLSVMAGGDEADVAAVMPALRAVGRTIVHLGPLGSGQLAKACNQLVVAVTVTALAEATRLAEATGLDRGAVLDVLGGGLAASEVLRQKRDHLVSGDFRGDGPARFLVKDLGFVADAARDAGVDLPTASTVAGLFEALTAAGLGDLDNSVVLEWLRR